MLSILVVQDFNGIGLSPTQTLTEHGHRVIRVETCAEAITAIQEADAQGQPFHAIVANFRVVDGLTMTVCQQVEERVQAGALRFVAISANWANPQNRPSWTYFNEVHATCLHSPLKARELLAAVE